MKILAAALSASVVLAGPALAADVVPAYRSLAADAPEGRSLWTDYLTYLEPGARSNDGQRPPAILVATAKAGNDVWTVTQLDVDAYCGDTTCATRVFRNEDLVFSGDACYVVGSHVLRPDALEFRACDRSFALARIDQR